MSDKEQFSYSGAMDRAHLADYLASLATALRDGSVRLAAGERSMALDPGSNVQVQLSASKDTAKGRGSIELELSWRQPDAEAAKPELEITAGAPAISV